MFPFDFNYSVWYGCYEDKGNVNCIGPYETYVLTKILLEKEIYKNTGDNYEIIPHTIKTTCIFMPEFIRQIKIRNKVKLHVLLDNKKILFT